MKRRLLAAVLLACALAAGCRATYRAETTLHADGRVERAIFQPLTDTPEAVRRPELWEQVTFAPESARLDEQELAHGIRGLAVKGPDKERPYFAAWGTFKTAGDVPDHFVVHAPERSGLEDSRLARDYVRNDYVFVVEHRWRETLTDAVTQDAMRRARDELGDLLINLAADTFDEAVGANYDAKDLTKWARTEGKAALAELTDFAYLHCATNKGLAGDRGLAQGLAAITERYGLVLTDKNGKFLDNDDAGKALDEFLVGLITKHVRDKENNRPVDEKRARAWVADLMERDGDKNKSTLFRPALERVVEAKYGGRDALNARFGVLLARTFGLHWDGFLFDHHHFDWTLTVPGEVVETNGELLAGNRVRWKFKQRWAYPLGYPMTCRSLAPQPEAQRALLKGQPLEGREALLRFAELVAEDEPLPGVLQECRKQKAMKPLYEYREQATRKGDGEAVKRVNRLLQMLKLPAQG